MQTPGPDYTPPGSASEVLSRYAAGERYFGEMELEDGPDFRGACLAGAIFDGSYLMDGDFRDADLRGASFRRVYVKCSDFRGADLRGASFVDAGLESTRYEGAKYDGSEFVGGYCYGMIEPGDGFPDYGEPRGPGPDYRPPESPAEVLRRYAAGERYFGDMELVGMLDFRGACLVGAVFDGSDMLEGDFRDADLRGASFRRTYIKVADFRGADVRGATFVGASVEATRFEGAKYEGQEFVGAYCYSNTIKPGDSFPD